MNIGIYSNYFSNSQYARTSHTVPSSLPASADLSAKRDTYTRNSVDTEESRYISAFSDFMKKNRVSESTSSFDEKQSEFGELTAEQKAELKNKYGATGEISSTDALAILSELVDMKIVPGRYATMAFEEYAPAVDGIMVQRVLTPPEYNFGSETLLGMLERSMRNMQSLLDTSPTYLSGEPVKIDRERAEEHIKVQEKIRDLIADIMKD